MSGGSNTLVREFLADVHQLSSAAAEGGEDEEERRMLKLSEYLVRGRGFLLLHTLDHVMDQVGMSTGHRPHLSRTHACGQHARPTNTHSNT